MSFFSDLIKVMFPIKEKTKEAKDVIGHYNSKPFHNFRYALIYANETPIIAGEDLPIEIFARIYNGTTFVNVLVNKEDETFDCANYTYEKLLPRLMDAGLEETERNIVLILFQHRNEFTIKECKRFAKSTDKSFHQGLVFNPVEVQMDYYMPVPVYKRLNKHMCELLYFDLAFIDDDKR